MEILMYIYKSIIITSTKLYEYTGLGDVDPLSRKRLWKDRKTVMLPIFESESIERKLLFLAVTDMLWWW